MADTLRFQHFEIPLREDGSPYELGRGAMGITYKAFDTNLRSLVALKVVNANYLDNEVARQRFLREARAAAALRHPNVANVFHLGEQDGNYFYAMEFVDGETVEALMKREGAIPSVTALNITLQVARALGAAQKQGLVHRDIKPANLMLVTEEDEDFTVKVIDFGLAKNTAGGADMATLTLGGFLGTPHFASPEQLEERDLDVRSDIYSLGVTLYYMLAGRAPFSGSLAQVMSQHLHREAPLETLTGQPQAVIDLLRHMLAKDASARPQTPADLRREIEACLEAVKATPAAAPAAPLDTENFETQILNDDLPPPPAIELAPEAVIAGRFRILKECPADDFGRLFKAVSLETSESVALLVLDPTFLASAEACTHIEDQVLAIQKISSPAIQKIHSIERIDALVFLIFEWVEGPTLLDLMRTRKALPPAEALTILRPLATAFDALFSAGIPCPDLTSHEVVLNGGDVSKPIPAGGPIKFNAISPDSPIALPGATLVSSPFAMMRDSGAFTGKEARAFVYELASLAYEILGGIRSGSSSGSPVPIAGLTEEANSALRRALNLSSSSFPSCTVLLDAMQGLAVPEEIAEEMPEEDNDGWQSAPPPNVVPPIVVPPVATVSTAPQRNSNPVPLIAAGSAVILIAAVLAIVFFKLSPRTVAPPAPTSKPTPAATPQSTPAPTPTPTPTPIPTPTPDPIRTELNQILQPPSTDPVATMSALLDLERKYPDKPEIHNEFVRWLNAFLDKTAAMDPNERDDLLHSLESAANKATPNAGILLGEVLIKQRPADSLKWFLTEAEKENSYAMIRAGRMLAFGSGSIASDNVAAAKLFQQAVDLNDPMAMYYLGECYLYGKGVERDARHAVRLLTSAAVTNNVLAMAVLGDLYKKGIPGVIQPSLIESFRLLSSASGLGQLEARGNLGVLYLNGGEGIEKDEKQAVELFKSGAEQQNPLCMFYLAKVLEDGTSGVQRDPEEAKQWYLRAAQLKNPPAIEWCKKHNIPIPAGQP